MQVEVFSDVVCPWCYIGKRRLEEALAAFPHADAVTVTYRSFQLDPSAPVGSDSTLAESLAAKYHVSPEQARSMNDRVAGVAATVGLDFDMSDAHPANTWDAHRLLHFAATRGRQAELKERLMRAYFTEGIRVDDHAELTRLAGEAGLDQDDAAAVLATGQYADDVESDLALARNFGVSGVPFFVFDRRYGVSGAQETAVLTEVLDRAWADSAPLAMMGRSTTEAAGGTSEADGPGCANGACAI